MNTWEVVPSVVAVNIRTAGPTEWIVVPHRPLTALAQFQWPGFVANIHCAAGGGALFPCSKSISSKYTAVGLLAVISEPVEVPLSLYSRICTLSFFYGKQAKRIAGASVFALFFGMKVIAIFSTGAGLHASL